MDPYRFPGDGRDGVLVYQHGGPSGLGWTIFALQLLLVLGVAWLLASLVIGRMGRRPAVAAPVTPPAGGPLDTLQMRYARGEIDRETYFQARADLGDQASPRPEPPTET